MRILLLWALLLSLLLPAAGGDIREFTASPATLCLGEPLDLALFIEGATPRETPRVDFLLDGAPAGSLELLPVSGAAGLQAQWRPPQAGGYTARPRLEDRPGPSSDFSVVVCLPREGGNREGFLFSTGNPRVLRQPLLREALRGEAFLMGLSLENTGDAPLSLEPKFPGLPAGWVAAEPPRLTLERGARGNFSLLASIPGGAEPGDYPAAILLGATRAPFLLRVRAGETNTSRPILTRSVDLEEVPPDVPRVVLLPRARVTLRFWNGAQPSSRAELVEQVPPALAARPAAMQFPDAAPERLPGEPPLLRWVLQ
ncbi:MAG: hypothetical protein HY558_01315, partial [Euryarchaeota archaeon]|nr:hypothetical protein [Euryarchaeota archaeon]